MKKNKQFNNKMNIAYRLKKIIKNRKCDVILINLPPWTILSPPIGLGYLNAYLESKQFNTKIIDLNIKLYNSNNDKKIFWKTMNFDRSNFSELVKIFKQELNKHIKEILDTDAELVAFGVNRISIPFFNYISEKLRASSNKKIIVGGYITSLKGEIKQLNLNSVDFLIFGEAEETLAELVSSHYSNKSTNKIQGLGIIKQGKIRYNKRRSPIKNLSKIPFPKYDKFNLKQYTSKSISMVLSRGCISKCSYCGDRNRWKKYRFRSAENVFEEIIYHQKKGVELIFFDDLLINGNIIELKKLCDLLIKNSNKIQWGGNALPNHLLSDKLLKTMKNAGCKFLRFGIESGSDIVLKNMNKNITAKNSSRILKTCSKLGIETGINLIVGLPGETDEEFEKTVKFLIDNKNYIFSLSNIFTAYLSPLSDLGKHPEKYNIIHSSDNSWAYYWSDNLGNTPRVREERLKRLAEICHELNISLGYISAWKHNSFYYDDIKNNFNDLKNKIISK